MDKLGLSNYVELNMYESDISLPSSYNNVKSSMVILSFAISAMNLASSSYLILSLSV